MSSRSMMIFAAISGFVFVALGAFGAHVLSRTLGAAEMDWLHTGLQYQGIHTLAILGLAALMQRRKICGSIGAVRYWLWEPCCFVEVFIVWRCRILNCGCTSRLSAAFAF